MTLNEALQALHVARQDMLLRRTDERRWWYERECRDILLEYAKYVQNGLTKERA